MFLNRNCFSVVKTADGMIIRVLDNIDIYSITSLITYLRRNKKDFFIYDPIFFNDNHDNNDSDKGAFISYSRNKAADHTYWSMTMGNHGWSGGIYQVKEFVIVQQICSLIKKGLLNEIKIENVVFFSKYPAEPEIKNIALNNRLFNLHRT